MYSLVAKTIVNALVFWNKHSRQDGKHPDAVHIEAAVDIADEEEELPLAPWH